MPGKRDGGEAAGRRSGGHRSGGRRRALAVVAIGVVLLAAAGAFVWTWSPSLPPGHATVVIPSGSTFDEVVDSLESAQVTGRPSLFRIVARVRGLDRSVKAGTYLLERGAPVGEVMDALTRGRVVTHLTTVPEGLTLNGIASRIAAIVERDSATVAQQLALVDSLLTAGRFGREGGASSDEAIGAGTRSSGGGTNRANNPADDDPADADPADDDSADDMLPLLDGPLRDLPGPGIEGYLFPDSYRFAQGVAVAAVVEAMIDRYRRYWTPERSSRLAEIGMTERELVTLASIVQSEAAVFSEMPTIASVFHNRLRIGMRLQADPTVLYALGGHRPRLLYAAMDSVADHPYNTYTHVGLPPGPISAPGADALDATLWPADTDYLYFVADSDGTHRFSRSLREHNRNRAAVRSTPLP